MRFALAAATTIAMAAPALAQEMSGDAEAGESVFRQCQTCHVVENEEGETLAGRNAQTGPNLYGVVGRQAGTNEDFNYGDDIVAAGEAGLNWDEEALTSYLQDPTGFLREYLDDSGARGKMSYRVRSEEDAHDVIAYLHSLAEGSGES